MVTPLLQTKLRTELSKKEVKEFQQLYRKHFGVTIDRKKAFEQGASLANLISLVYQPTTHKELKQAMKGKNSHVAAGKTI